MALWWLGGTRASVAHAERAYAGFRRAGDAVAAASTAVFLCMTWASNFDNHAVAGGWLARAERLAGEVDPNPLQGWLWLLRGYLEPDPGRAHALHRRVLELARASGDVDLELCALGDLGVSLVTAGRRPRAPGPDRRGDGRHPRRRTSSPRHRGHHLLRHAGRLRPGRRPGAGRPVVPGGRPVHRPVRLPVPVRPLPHPVRECAAGQGRWAEAEQELRAAVRMAEGTGPGPYADALARLAELRLRQGRLEDGAEPHIHGERQLRVAAALETLVVARLALGDRDGAAAAGGRIAGLAAGDGGQVAALAALAAAHLATVDGRPDEARRELELAQRLFISRKTAAHHVSNVLAKLGARNRAGAIAYATRQADRG